MIRAPTRAVYGVHVASNPQHSTCLGLILGNCKRAAFDALELGRVQGRVLVRTCTKIGDCGGVQAMLGTIRLHRVPSHCLHAARYLPINLSGTLCKACSLVLTFQLPAWWSFAASLVITSAVVRC
jgi:hypothetical protein